MVMLLMMMIYSTHAELLIKNTCNSVKTQFVIILITKEKVFSKAGKRMQSNHKITGTIDSDGKIVKALCGVF